MEVFKVRKGYLTIIKGRPASGKTSGALLDIVNRIYQGEKFLFFQYELEKESFIRKIVKRFNYDFDEGTHLTIIDALFIGLNKMIEIIKENKPNYVYIDYEGAIIDENKENRDREEFVYCLCDELSKLAKSDNIAIVLLMQQTRDYVKDRKVETAFFGLRGFNKIIKNVPGNNVIPMFIEHSLFDGQPQVVYLFDSNGKYEKYSEFNTREIYKNERFGEYE